MLSLFIHPMLATDHRTQMPPVAAAHAAAHAYEYGVEPMFAIDAEGTMHNPNATARRLLPDANWAALWSTHQAAAVNAALEQARQDGMARCEAGLAGSHDSTPWQLALHRLPESEGAVLVTLRRQAPPPDDNEARARRLLSAHCNIVWSTRMFGQFDTDQPGWRAFTGQSEAELMGRGWINALHPDDRSMPYVMPSHLTTVFETEYRLRHVSGAYRNMVVRMLPLLDEHGAVREWLGSHTDVTTQRQGEQQLRLAMQGGRMGTWEIDLGSGSLHCSEACRANFGLLAHTELNYAQLTGAMLDGDLQQWQEAVRTAIAAAEDFEIDLRVRWPDGSLHWVHMRGTCTSDGAGNVITLSGISLDLTASKHNEEALRLTLAAGEVATWSWDIVSDLVTADRNMARLFPLQPQPTAPTPLASYLSLIHPDDLPHLNAKITEAIEVGQPFEASYRIEGADGQTRHVLARGRVEYGPDGTPLRLPGVILDITRQKQIEDALHSSEERYGTLIELMDQAYCVIEMLYDADGYPVDWRYLEGNPAFVKQSGLENAFGRTIREMVPEHDQHWFNVYDEVLRTGRPIRYENEAHAMQRWFDIYATRLGGPGSRKLAVLFSDISERKRSELQLRKLADDLSEMDRRKTEFLATLAHELRNPLAPIRNGLQIMRMAADKPDTVARVRDVMERQVNQMVHLVDDLLDVARITRGQIDLKPERIDLKTVIASAVETNTPLIETNRHQLDLDMDSQPLLLDADPTRLAQVLGNLLNNAAKYTPAGGRISLTARRDGDEAVIAVRDSGMGIPPGALGSVFDMFTQVGQNMGRAQGGLGIGLSLVRRLVELHGGSASAASDGPGQGSTFTIRLPLLPLPPPIAQEADNSAPAASGQLRVLVVDDNIDAAETLCAILDMMGHQAEMVHDGAQALAHAPQFRPDVVFLDIGLPDMDGYAVARALRQTPAGQHCELVALTGWGGEDDRNQASAAGFNHHLTKPARIDAIGALLAGLSTSNQT